jgi:hypothetical protein
MTAPDSEAYAYEDECIAAPRLLIRDEHKSTFQVPVLSRKSPCSVTGEFPHKRHQTRQLHETVAPIQSPGYENEYANCDAKIQTLTPRVVQILVRRFSYLWKLRRCFGRPLHLLALTDRKG